MLFINNRGQQMNKYIVSSIVLILLLNGFSLIGVTREDTSSHPTSTLEKYDMVIISPGEFSQELQPFIEHKNTFNVKTFLKTVEEIYNEYSGRDEPEQIKYFIKDAIESYEIKYVLLVGGRDGQSNDWYVPERKSNCYTSFGDHGYSTDLYYADVYKYENDTLVFEDWDSNGNGIFAEWSWQPFGDYDYIDYRPDICLGRLACRNINEVTTVVNKIIEYETNTPDPSWFNRFITLGNDLLVPDPHRDYTGIAEGDVICDIASHIMGSQDFDTQRLYPSDGSLVDSSDFIDAFNLGAGFMLLTAHGSPLSLRSHDINSTEGIIVFNAFKDMAKINNEEKLPIIVNLGCHSSQFNVTLSNLLSEIINSGGLNKYIASNQFYKYNWAPECINWWWVRLSEGGAIATIGNTHYGKMEKGNTPYYFLEDLNPWIVLRFFENYANQSSDVLGDIFAQTITDYVDMVGGVNGGARYPPLQRNTVEEWVLFGDPSLKIGGYS